MVNCSLYGRYGNQLFQVSATIAYSLKHNMYYSIPKNGLNFGVKTHYKFPNQTDLKADLVYYQPTHGYTEIPKFSDIHLNGHFQSEKYFEGFKDEIRKSLEFPKATINKCAIHVRRGDYVKDQSRFPLLPIEYYEKAIRLIYEKGITEFVIFSDDVEWCRTAFMYGMSFCYPNSDLYLKVSFVLKDALDAVIDLKHMAEYKYMIIANSSYSLFASLINDKECVVAPSEDKWFGKGVNLETKDLMPERFIKI